MTTATPIPERLKALKKLTVHTGKHPAPPNGEPEGCALELASWVCGLEWGDHPDCVHPALANLIIGINDALEDDELRTRLMRKVIPLALNTADRAEEIDAMLDGLAVRRLRETVLPLAETWPEGIRDKVKAAVEGCGRRDRRRRSRHFGRRRGRRRSESAAESAWSARSAESESAAESAEESAWSAWSAWSAAESAWSAAESA